MRAEAEDPVRASGAGVAAAPPRGRGAETASSAQTRPAPNAAAAADVGSGPTLDGRHGHTAIATDGLPSVLGAPRPPRGYVLEEVIGTGGMAVVHRARVVETGRVVALKLMQEAMAADATLVARFRREVLATSSLDHDNVVRVLDFADDGEAPFMVAELVDGGSLRGLMSEVGPLPPLVALLLVDDLLCGLAHAHARGLVHRDLKPANLLLTTAGRLKLNDFGIASLNGEPTLTRPGDIIGTPSYMSPEQALGLPVGPASDLFSVGTVLYEMISGVNPFAHESQSLTLSRVCAAHATPIFELDPTVPPGIERLLHVLLEADPALRCKSADDALVMLRATRAQLSSTSDELMRRIVLEPQATVDLVRAAQAAKDVADARAALAKGRGRFSNASARAAFLAFRASTLSPHNAVALELRTALSARHGFSFRAAPSNALRALEAMIVAAPSAPELVQRAAVVARMDGDLVRAAALFKRYLRQRPADEHARQQLAGIVGDDVGITFADPASAHGGKGARRLTSRPSKINLTAVTRSITRGSSIVLTDHRPLAVAAAAFLPVAIVGYPMHAVGGAIIAWCAVRVVGYFRRVARAEALTQGAHDHPASPSIARVSSGPHGALSGLTNTDVARASEETRNASGEALVGTSVAGASIAGASVAGTSIAGTSSATPPAFSSALRELAKQIGPAHDDATVRLRLERAACSLELEQRSTALADLEAALALMSLVDPRRPSAASMIARIRQL